MQVSIETDKRVATHLLFVYMRCDVCCRAIKNNYVGHYDRLSVSILLYHYLFTADPGSVTRLGDLLDFEQLFKAFRNN